MFYKILINMISFILCANIPFKLVYNEENPVTKEECQYYKFFPLMIKQVPQEKPTDNSFIMSYLPYNYNIKDNTMNICKEAFKDLNFLYEKHRIYHETSFTSVLWPIGEKFIKVWILSYMLRIEKEEGNQLHAILSYYKGDKNCITAFSSTGKVAILEVDTHGNPIQLWHNKGEFISDMEDLSVITPIKSRALHITSFYILCGRILYQIRLCNDDKTVIRPTKALKVFRIKAEDRETSQPKKKYNPSLVPEKSCLVSKTNLQQTFDLEKKERCKKVCFTNIVPEE